MADPITWYTLAKAVDDTTSIDEEIDALVLTHNLDPSAHGQENESVYEHRASALLDHLSYSIYNIKTNPAARIYKAIVGTGAEADFTTIQQAIDWANLYGGGTVFIKAGTYNISSDITLYSNITLLGEDDDLTILDFGASSASIQAVGTSGTHKKSITLEHLGFKNGENEDQLIFLKYVDDVVIEQCKFSHDNPTITILTSWISTDAGCNRIFIRENQFLSGPKYLNLNLVNRCWILENYFFNCQRDMIVGGGGSHVIIRNNVFENARLNISYTGAIFIETDIVNLHIEGNQFINCRGGAIFLSNMVRSLVIDNRIDGSADTDYGINLYLCMRCTVVSNNIDNVNQAGIYAFDSDKNNITGNTCTNCDDSGVNIDGAACDKNLVLGNVLTDNGTALKDTGTGTVKDHNVT